jgi:hypothetical protein
VRAGRLGDASLPSKRTVCMIHPDNSHSVYVVKKFGCREFASTKAVR